VNQVKSVYKMSICSSAILAMHVGGGAVVMVGDMPSTQGQWRRNKRFRGGAVDHPKFLVVE